MHDEYILLPIIIPQVIRVWHQLKAIRVHLYAALGADFGSFVSEVTYLFILFIYTWNQLIKQFTQWI